jgi:chromosome partitioning protein
VTRIYTLANQKGGVGKTTTAVSLGACLAARLRNVLLVDADPQANATSSLGLDKHQIKHSVYHALIDQISLADIVQPTDFPRLHIAPSSPALAGAVVEMVRLPSREYLLQKALSAVASQYDYTFIDTPPSLGLLTVNALTAADGVLIPVQCEYLALEGLGQLIHTVNLVRKSLNPQLRIAGLILTMYDRRTNLSQQVVEEVGRHFPQEVFKTIIPRNVRLSEAPSHGLPIINYDPTSYGAVAYQTLAGEFLEREDSRQAEGKR